MFVRLRLDKITTLLNRQHIQSVMQYERQVYIYFRRTAAPFVVTAVSDAMAKRIVRKISQN